MITDQQKLRERTYLFTIPIFNLIDHSQHGVMSKDIGHMIQFIEDTFYPWGTFSITKQKDLHWPSLYT